MPERSPYPNLSDREIEGLISSLPGARPPADLRERVLRARPGRAGRPGLALRPALAALTLAVLLLADVAVTSWPVRASWSTQRRISEAMVAEALAQRRELGLEGRPLIFLSAPSPAPISGRAAAPDSYWSLRRKLDTGV